MTTLTDREKEVIKSIAESEYRDGREDLTLPVWSFSECGITGKAYSAIIASLNKKGIVISRGSGEEKTVELTLAGVEAYKAAEFLAGRMVLRPKTEEEKEKA